MRIVYETEDKHGNKIHYISDDDQYLLRAVYHPNGILESETYIDGECGCRSCNESRDWSKFK